MRLMTTRQARATAAARKTHSGGRNGGRPRSSKPRCACGAMTANRAEARKHQCVACSAE